MSRQTYIRSTARLSECGRYRYELYRQWDESKSDVLFVMLNPSTADHTKDDRTIMRCVGFAQRWGYGGLLVGNLFALRSTNPEKLYRNVDPVGLDNDAALQSMVARVDVVIAAWGNHGELQNRNAAVLPLLSGKCHALLKNKTGHPAHPSRLSYNAVPFPYSGP